MDKWSPITIWQGSSFENCARTKSSCTLLTFISGYPNLPSLTSPWMTPRVAQRAWIVNRLWLEMQRRVQRTQKVLSKWSLRYSMALVVWKICDENTRGRPTTEMPTARARAHSGHRATSHLGSSRLILFARRQNSLETTEGASDDTSVSDGLGDDRREK